MTLKLTPPQAEALFNLFNELVLLNLPNGLDEQLVSLHMVSIYKKLRAKWEGDQRKSYSLKLNQPEALAYRIYWRDNDTSAIPYECSILIDQCTQIDQELSNRITRTINIQKLLNQ